MGKLFATVSQSQQGNNATKLSKNYLVKPLGLLDNKMLENTMKDRIINKIFSKNSIIFGQELRNGLQTA